MGRFAFIAYGYILYLISLMVINAWYSVEGKPILALGFISQWWFAMIVFLFVYISEFVAIFLERRDE